MTRLTLLSCVMIVALAGSTIPVIAQEAAPIEAADPAAVQSYPAITVSTVTSLVLRDRVIASGLVAAVEEVQVQPLVEGQAIDVLLADVGDVVTEGQVLARLSGSTLDLQRSELMASKAAAMAGIAQSEANLIEAQATAAEANRVATRNVALAAQGSIPAATAETSTANAESAQARVRVAEQGIASAQAQLELSNAQLDTLALSVARTEVKSPANGLIVTRNAVVGAIASAAGQPMFTIVRDGAMELRAEISEQDLLRVAPGQEVTLTTIGGSAPLMGHVRLVEPTINTTTRLGLARITVDDPSIVRTGMFLTAEILVSAAETLTVPVSAVGSGADGSMVMRVRDGLVERVVVKTGVRDGGMIGILEGLSEGDQVVTRAAAFVRDGDRINPVPAADMAALSEEG